MVRTSDNKRNKAIKRRFVRRKVHVLGEIWRERRLRLRKNDIPQYLLVSD